MPEQSHLPDALDAAINTIASEEKSLASQELLLIVDQLAKLAISAKNLVDQGDLIPPGSSVEPPG